MRNQRSHTFCYIIYFSFSFFLASMQLHCTNLQRQSEQCDESTCIVMIIHITGCEGSQGLIVEAVWRSGSGFDDIAFVKLEFYFAGHIFLSGLATNAWIASRSGVNHFPSYTTWAHLVAQCLSWLPW